MADKINQIEIGGITYDLQDKKSIFSGTAEEYEAVADTIEDGTLINITDDFVEGETLETHVLNKVDELEGKLDSSVKTREELMTNAEEGNLVDALAIKEALNYYNVGKYHNVEYASLEAFIQNTATDIMVPNIGRVKDTTGWGPNQFAGLWYRYIVIYQNPCDNDVHNINGNGIFWTDVDMWNISINGTKSTGHTLTCEKVNKPTIKTRQDLMSNTVSGLFPDALAVKDEINLRKVCRHTGGNFATVEEFVETLASSWNVDNGEIFKSGIAKDTGGWGPKATSSSWYKYMLVSQNSYSSGQQHPTSINGVFMDEAGKFWLTYIYGKKDEGLTTKYIDISNTKYQVITDTNIDKTKFGIFGRQTITSYGRSHHIHLFGEILTDIAPGNTVTIGSVPHRLTVHDIGNTYYLAGNGKAIGFCIQQPTDDNTGTKIDLVVPPSFNYTIPKGTLLNVDAMYIV